MSHRINALSIDAVLKVLLNPMQKYSWLCKSVNFLFSFVFKFLIITPNDQITILNHLSSASSSVKYGTWTTFSHFPT